LLTGVSGAGKSSIALGLSQTIADVLIYEFGELMAVIGARMDLVEGYVDLPGLALAERVRLQQAAAQEVSRSTGPVVVVAHVIVVAPEGYVNGLPDEVLDFLCLSGVMVVRCSPGQIWARRKHSSSLHMHDELQEIAAQQHEVDDRAKEIADGLCVPLGYIDNSDGEFRAAVAKAAQLWKRFGDEER